MAVTKMEVANPETLVKKVVWLAWQACGGPFGMGQFQDRPNATEAEVWAAAVWRRDYAGIGTEPAGKVNCDYVFGRMMKLRLQWDESGVMVPQDTPRPDYQAWCPLYPTYLALFEAALAATK